MNDLALLGDLLVSCSNDRTLRVWSAANEGKHGGGGAGGQAYLAGEWAGGRAVWRDGGAAE